MVLAPEHLRCLLHDQGFIEVVALGRLAVHLPRESELSRGFHSIGDYLEV